MHPNFYLSPLAVCAALTLASSAKAAEPLPLDHMGLQSLQQKFQMGNGANAKFIRGAQANDALELVSSHRDNNKVNHIRMQQTYAGYPVFGGYAIVHKSNQDAVLNGLLYQGLTKELGQAPAKFEVRGQQALAQFKASFPGKTITEEKVSPMVYIGEDNKAHWAYKVSILITLPNDIPERPSAIMDANSFEHLVSWDGIQTAIPNIPVRAMGYGGNNKVGAYAFGLSMPFLEITRSPDNENPTCYLENPSIKVIDMKSGTSSKTQAMQFPCKPVSNTTPDIYWTGYKGNGLDKGNGAFSPSNDAFYSGMVIKHMYRDWYNIEVLTKKDGSPLTLVMRVHYGEGYENAFWDGKQMTFGDGATMMYPLVSLGIAAHEISHGFTEQHSGLQYFGQSGGMNESFSDMAAQAAEYYSSKKSSWRIGAEIMKEDSGYETLRYMDVPSKDGGSIDSASDYHSGLDVHHSSGVYNRLYYLMSNLPGWDPRKAFDVMVKANVDYWTPYSTFAEGACGVLSAAKDLGYSTEGVKESLATVEIGYQSCRNQ